MAEFREDVSFDLKGFSPTRLCALPNHGCLVAVSSSGGLRSLDLVSGTQVHATEVLTAPSPLLCLHHEQSGKLVVGAGGILGARGAVGGCVMLHTILQPPVADSENMVSIELSLAQAEVLWSELEGIVLPQSSAHSTGGVSGSKQWSTRLASVIAQLARGVRKTREKDSGPNGHPMSCSTWQTVSFEGPVQQLFSLFDDLLSKMKIPRGGGVSATLGNNPPSLSSTVIPTSPSPALPLVAAICLRLRLLHPDHCPVLQQLQEGREIKDQKMVCCEAVRKLSLRKWPHKNYVWAVPSAMAAAGFFHLGANMAGSGFYKADRVSCFACHVYLYSWEPNDEPWSEHERHAMQCPFMRGEPTENIPLEVTEGTHPAVEVTSDPTDSIAFIASSSHSSLVAVATKQGVLSVWDISGCLCIMLRARLELRVDTLHSLLQIPSHEDECQQDEISSFSLTSLSLLSPPGDSSPVLVTAVTVHHTSGPSHSVLLLHSVVDAPPSGTSPPAPTTKGAAPLIPTQPSPSHFSVDFDIVPLSIDIPDFSLSSPPYLPPSHFAGPIPPSTATTSLHDLLADHMDMTLDMAIGSLRFLSFLPVSKALLDLHGNYGVQLLHPLPSSHLLAVYMRRTRPHPPTAAEVKSYSEESTTDKSHLPVGVKGQDNEGPHGCLLLLRYSEGMEGSLCLCPEPVARLVTVCSGDVIVDMCHVAVDGADAKETCEVMVVVTAHGDLQLLDVGTLQVLASHKAPGECGYCNCTAWSANGGWVAAVTGEGRVEVVRVCDVRGREYEEETTVELDSEAANLEHSILTQRMSPPVLDQLLSLTHTSPVGVAYTYSAPLHWREISLQQFHRKIPTHMHSVPVSGEHHVPGNHTRVWQYLPPPTIKNNRANDNSAFHFEVSLDSSCPALGCVSVRLCLPSARCLSDTATVSLLLPARGEGGRASTASGFRYGGHRGTTGHEGAKVLCGPIKLKPLVDITGCVVQASFTHPLLLSSSLPLALALRLEQLFPADYSEAVMSAAEAHTPSTVKTGPLRRRGCVRHSGGSHRLQQQMNTKCRAVPEQCYLSLSLYPLCRDTRPAEVEPCMDTLLQLMEKRDFILNLTLGACRYRVTRQEYDGLLPSLQAVVDGCKDDDGEGGGSKDSPATETHREGGMEAQLQCLQLLCWVGCVHDGVSDKEGVEMVRAAVGQLLVSLLHACFFYSHSRQTAHYCSRLIVSLHRPHELSPSAGDFSQRLLRALPPLLPLLPLCSSAACVHWFLRVMSVVAVRSNDQHMISQHCLELLVELAGQLQAKSGPLPQLLHTHFGQDGSVFEESLYDIYLSYYQKSISMPIPHKTYPSITAPSFTPSISSHLEYVNIPWEQLDKPPPPLPPKTSYTKLAPLMHNAHPPSTSSQSGPQVIYTEKRSQTIYDAELKLLLKPPPKTPEQVKLMLGEFPPFQHGSFLLYSQRGLLEAYPLEYTCCSVTGNATVQEPVYQNVNSTSTPPPTSQTGLTSSTKSSGYFYPTGPSGRSSGASHTSSMAHLSSQLYPNELTSSETIPKELVMHIDVLQSGQVYSAVLQFGQLVYLTDLSLSTNLSMGCVSVDVWGGGGEGEAVRVAQCTEIQEKNLMLGNLMPPPLCQFVKVTYTGKLGATREKAQAFLGAFYGIPLMSKPPQKTLIDPRKPEILHRLERRLLSEYCSARDKLTASLTALSGDMEGGQAGHPKQLQDSIRERYQTCFLAQTLLARLRHYMTMMGEASAPGTGGVFSVEEEAGRVDFTGLSLSQLYRLAGCLVNTLLVLCGPGESDESRPGPTSTAPLSMAQLPVVSEKDCQLLLSSLCIHGVLRVQARVCGLLLRLCASQPWWGDMVVMTATSLFASNQPCSFNKERAMLQLSALCQRSYQHGPVLTCLLHSLSSLLAPLLAPLPPSSSSSSSATSAAAVDQQQLQWLVLLLSHTLSSLYSSSHSSIQKDPNLFGPTLSIPLSQSSLQNMPQTMSQAKEADAATERRPAVRSRLGPRASRRQAAAPDNRQTPVPSPPSPLLTLPFPLSHDVTRGLLGYVLSLIDQRDWIMLPVVCKAISLLVQLTSHPLPLTSILTSSQLTLLFSTACAPLTSGHGNSTPSNQSPSNMLGNQQWACRAIQWMVMSLLYHGDIAPHVEQCQRERGEGEGGEGELVGHVEETDLPVREEAEVLVGRLDEVGGKEGEVKESPAVGKPAITKTWEELEEVNFPNHPLLLVCPEEQYGEQEYELMSLMTDHDTLFSNDPMLTSVLPDIYEPLTLPPVTTVMSSSKLKPVALLPPPLPVAMVDTPVTTATHPIFLPKTSKPKKKLSKHLVKSFKYAPGDYTEVPNIRPVDSGTAASTANLNPYRSFIISSAVDHRLQHSVEFPTELALQTMARAQYKAVLASLVTAASTGPLERDGEGGGSTKDKARGGGEEGLESVCGFIRGSLEQLLASLTSPQPSVDMVAVLQLWNELNTLLPASHPQGASGSENSSISPQSDRKQLQSFCSPELLVALVQCLCHAPSRATTWQIGLSLLRQFICHLSTPHTPSSIPLHPSQLSQLLLTYFPSGENNLEVGVARGVVLDLLKEVIPLQLVGTSVCDGGDVTRGGEGVRGAHVLLEVLVELLEQRSSLLDSPLLYPLLDALSESEVPRLLFPPVHIPCATAVACIHKLLVVTVSLVRSTQLSGPWQNVLLYTADLDGDRMRYRYRNAGGGRLKWVLLPHGNTDSAHRSKVTSELIQLVRQLLSVSSDTIPDSAHKAIQEFIGKDKNEGQEAPNSSPHPLLPLTTLVYSDSSLLSKYLSLLNSLVALTAEEKTPQPPSGKTPPPAPLLSDLPSDLFVNFLHFLYLHCPNRTCFFRPVLEALGSAGEETPISKPFLHFVSRLTSDLAQDVNHRQLDQFISDGGARLVFECFVQSSSVPPSLPHSSSSSGSLASAILRLGQHTTPKPFREGSQLVNFLPAAKLQVTPNRTPVQDLQMTSPVDPPSRSSTFHHTFQSGEEELVMTASLPHPILFCALQLFQPSGSLQNGPSSILIETSSRPGLSPPLPVTPTINTKGLSCIKVKLQSPVVAQEVRVHLRRPAVSDSISLSRIYFLGMGYGGPPGEGEEKKSADGRDPSHPNCSWLAIVDSWLDLPEASHQRLLEEASSVPQLLRTCLSLITTHHHTLSSTSSDQLLRLLLALAAHNPDHGQTLVQHLMGFSSEAMPTVTPPAVELFHGLCVPNTEHGMQRLSFCLRLLSSLTYPHSSLPILVRALSSAVWRGDSKWVASLVSEDLFSSLAEAAISSAMDLPLKPALNSLLCSLCSHAPHLFTLLLDRCLTALNAAKPPHLPPDLSPLLFTLAHTAQSPTCSPILLSSLLLPSILAELCSNFTRLASWVTETPKGRSEDHNDGDSPATGSWSSLLPRSCAFLAFLTDFSQNWITAKTWLGSGPHTALWPPLLQFLSLAEHHPHCISALELNFVQDVGTEFFRAVLQGSADNKTLFSRLLTNSICGSYSLEKPELTQPHLRAAALTAFTYRLLVDLVLDPEPLMVVLEPPLHRRGDNPFVPLSLPLTCKSPTFHPSFPVSQHSYLISLPHSVPTSHLIALCQAHGNTDEWSKVTTVRRLPPAPTDSGPHVLPVNAFEYKKSAPPQKPAPQRGRKSELRSILKTAASQVPCVSFSLFSSPDTLIPAQAKLSELLTSSLLALTLTLHTSKPPSTVEGKKDSFVATAITPFSSPHPPLPSLLEAFASSSGLVPLSLCLPSLYPHLWPRVEEGEDTGGGRKALDSMQTKERSPSSVCSFSFTAAPDSLSSHPLITFGLCLRLHGYGDALMEHPPMARTLLKMLMGAEYKEPLSKAVSEQLPFVPYLLLLRMLRDHPAHEEVGVACRESVMSEGVIHQILASLSSFGHSPRIKPTDTPQGMDSSSQPVSKPGHGMTSGHRHYWAKGTGFGTGSTLSAWNVDAMRAKQKSEEKHVCLCFAILCEYLFVVEGCDQGEESWCSPTLADLLASSCLLPAMTAYLVNDSILDISKHIDLYQAALGVLYSLASHSSLVPLLTLPVFSDGEASSGRDGLTLFSLSKKLTNTVLTYVKTAKLKSKAGVSGPLSKTTPTATPTPIPTPIPPRRVRVRMNPTRSPTEEESPTAEAELTELTSAMLATAERVAAAVAEAEGGKEGSEREGEQGPSLQPSSDAYMENMRPLQFDTYQFLEEDETGRLNFLSSFHYEGRLQHSTAAVYGASRGRRLAQEVSALATSLPLSSSSSVFVRCDEDRLDVMKVLITGPSDTPYANGCFVFDVFFPAEYPQGPMLVNLMTTGQGTVRFNPNLYNDGKVCLSVLNTWHGRPEEKWNSENSSFLQVLVSIQSLVLVPDPYFNEPGYEQYRGTPYGDQKSLAYNANLYVATVQWAMLHQLQNPSPCFKEVILKHFLLRRDEVLSQCQQWKKAVVEGIERMQARGVATAHLKDYLRKLVKGVETLKVEIGKIEKKLSQTVDRESGTAETGHPNSSTGCPNSADSNPNPITGHPNATTGHPGSVDSNQISNMGYPDSGDTNPGLNTGCPDTGDTNPGSNAGHSDSVDENPTGDLDSHNELLVSEHQENTQQLHTEDVVAGREQQHAEDVAGRDSTEQLHTEDVVAGRKQLHTEDVVAGRDLTEELTKPLDNVSSQSPVLTSPEEGLDQPQPDPLLQPDNPVEGQQGERMTGEASEEGGGDSGTCTPSRHNSYCTPTYHESPQDHEQ